MNILIVTTWFPYPPDTGINIRVYNLIKSLSKYHRLWLISFISDAQNQSLSISHLEDFCEEINTVEANPYHERSIFKILGWLSPFPQSIISSHVPAMDYQLEKFIQEHEFDLIIASVIKSAVYVKKFRKIPKVIDLLEVTQFWEEQTGKSGPVPTLRQLLRRLKVYIFLRSLLPYFDICTIASEREEFLVKKIAGYDRLTIIPNGLDLSKYERRLKPKTLIPNSIVFNGSVTFDANYDAVHFFIYQIFPLIQLVVPDVSFTITGSTNGVEVSALKQKGVSFSGYVDDIIHFIRNYQICICPIRKGGGSRLKILEAMALGIPVVATSKGAEGLEVQHEQHLLIADTAEEFALQIIRLLKNPEFCTKLAENGRRLVEEKYNWEAVMPKFLEVIDNLVANKSAH